MQTFEPSTEVTVTGVGIKEAISNFNDQGYCSILKVLVVLCKHASKNSCVTCRIFITSTIFVFIASFSTIWLSIPADNSNKYRRRKLRAYILVSFLVQSCGLEFFYAEELGLEQWTVLDKNRVQQCRAPQASPSPMHLPTSRSVFRGALLGALPLLTPSLVERNKINGVIEICQTLLMVLV